ncbi:exported hypothetical protein [groundwater metagenome]|uniref:Uncharacterized protein n=1 Tax=groundwater metagenome TaxID=717931 RepID=A0A098E9L7_9ZZZZ
MDGKFKYGAIVAGIVLMILIGGIINVSAANGGGNAAWLKLKCPAINDSSEPVVVNYTENGFARIHGDGKIYITADEGKNLIVRGINLNVVPNPKDGCKVINRRNTINMNKNQGDGQLMKYGIVTCRNFTNADITGKEMLVFMKGRGNFTAGGNNGVFARTYSGANFSRYAGNVKYADRGLATIGNIGNVHVRTYNNNSKVFMDGKNVSFAAEGMSCKNFSTGNNGYKINAKNFTLCEGHGTLNISGEHLMVLGKDNVSMSAKGDGRIVLSGNNKNKRDNKNNKGDRCCCIDNCGDGICQKVVCNACNVCPCAENCQGVPCRL